MRLNPNGDICLIYSVFPSWNWRPSHIWAFGIAFLGWSTNQFVIFTHTKTTNEAMPLSGLHWERHCLYQQVAMSKRTNSCDIYLLRAIYYWVWIAICESDRRCQCPCTHACSSGLIRVRALSLSACDEFGRNPVKPLKPTTSTDRPIP